MVANWVVDCKNAHSTIRIVQVVDRGGLSEKDGLPLGIIAAAFMIVFPLLLLAVVVPVAGGNFPCRRRRRCHMGL